MEGTKTAVITGGTKGIGLALVNRFLSEGYQVITCARTVEGHGPKANHKVFKADLSKKEEVLAFANYVLEQTNKIDVLINNTGVFLPGTILEESEGHFELMLQTNLYSAYYLTRALISALKASAKGHLFNIGSTASIVAYPNGGSYCISKFALLGMTKVLREELKATKVRVTAVLPGATLTSSWDGVDLPADRFMPPSDVAEMIYQVYCLSPQTDVEELVLRPQLGDLG
jgi:NAD(P)-dependent dehydrogenase (short-subunit alcohol dehydrogenase family)